MGAFFIEKMQTLYAKKIGMTGKYTQAGERAGVTVLEIMPMAVESLRTVGKHGYKAVRFKVTDLRFKGKTLLREVRQEEEMENGAEVKVEDILQAGDTVKVTGTSKGKGFAGAVKRYGFKGGPRTHGQSDRERAPGSSGSGTTPGRVYKGKRRAGHMGNEEITHMKLKILEVDGEKRLVTLIGSVPGHRNSMVKLIKV